MAALILKAFRTIEMIHLAYIGWRTFSLVVADRRGTPAALGGAARSAMSG
jgi:hypothetical protein